VEQSQREPEQGRKLPDAPAKCHDLLPEFGLGEVDDGAADNRWGCAQPAPSGRSRDAALRRDAEVARALDEIPESVVVALL